MERSILLFCIYSPVTPKARRSDPLLTVGGFRGFPLCYPVFPFGDFGVFQWCSVPIVTEGFDRLGQAGAGADRCNKRRCECNLCNDLSSVT